LIITEAGCRYHCELSLGEMLQVYCRVAEIKPKMMRMQYEIRNDAILCAEGATTNLCYDYRIKKVVVLPQELVDVVQAFDALPA
jgi:acyl-CoA thioesterase FadM